MKEVNKKDSCFCFSLRNLPFGFLMRHILCHFPSHLVGGILASSPAKEKSANKKGSRRAPFFCLMSQYRCRGYTLHKPVGPRRLIIIMLKFRIDIPNFPPLVIERNKGTWLLKHLKYIPICRFFKKTNRCQVVLEPTSPHLLVSASWANSVRAPFMVFPRAPAQCSSRTDSSP